MPLIPAFARAGWFVVCWSAFVLASVAVGVLWSLYRQTTTDQVRRASAAIAAHGCDAIAGHYAFLVARTTRKILDLGNDGMKASLRHPPWPVLNRT